MSKSYHNESIVIIVKVFIIVTVVIVGYTPNGYVQGVWEVVQTPYILYPASAYPQPDVV